MKIQSLQLEYFKKFREQNLDFTDSETGLAKDLIVILGMNGLGKTSILQAIAATLGTATGRLQQISDLTHYWTGFNYELLSSNWGKFQPKVNLQVELSQSEIYATREFSQKLREMGRELIQPSSRAVINLQWRDEQVLANTAQELFQLKGREYAKQLVRSEGFGVFEKVGGILWYTEQRTSTSLTSEDRNNKIEITEDVLRDRLSKWQLFSQNVTSGKIRELRLGQKDLYAEIERNYQAIFPLHSFKGPVPREDFDDILKEPWFYLDDGKHQYEISEMSGGERAIFKILVEFAS